MLHLGTKAFHRDDTFWYLEFILYLFMYLIIIAIKYISDN